MNATRGATASEQTKAATEIAESTPVIEPEVKVQRSQLATLCRPFRSNLIHTNPSGGGSYVAHPVVKQKLLMVVGPYDFELVEILRGYVAEIKANPNADSKRAKEGRPALENAVVGAVCRLSCVVDGIPVRVEDVGDCEDPHNWPHDGARLKDAMSDAIKRCAAHNGVGLHLWCKPDEFIIDADLLDAAIARRKELP